MDQSNGMRGEFSVERRAVGGIQARASMKQKVEREIMNDRVSQHASVYICIHVWHIYTYCVCMRV